MMSFSFKSSSLSSTMAVQHLGPNPLIFSTPKLTCLQVLPMVLIPPFSPLTTGLQIGVVVVVGPSTGEAALSVMCARRTQTLLGLAGNPACILQEATARMETAVGSCMVEDLGTLLSMVVVKWLLGHRASSR